MAYRWSERTGQYIDSKGRFVSRATVRGSLDAAIQKSGREIRSLTQSLRDGVISLPDWQVRMAVEIKRGHVASAMLAKGGRMQLTPADLGRVGNLIREQYAYLRGFALEIEKGKQKLDGTALRRADLYGQSPRHTYHVIDGVEQQRRGMEQERSVLSVSEHCTGCETEAARGWVEIGTLVPIGARNCLSNCKCSMEYRQVGLNLRVA